MKQIYDFERKSPPVINENRIRAEIERRKFQRDIALLAVGSALLMLCFLLLAVQLFDTMPLISKICVAYVCIATAGGGLIVLVFGGRRELVNDGSNNNTFN